MTNLWKRSLSMFLAVVMVIGMLPMNVLAEGIDDTPTEPTSTETQPHEHAFNAGVCECGEKDPNYVPPHEHTFDEGVCECGEKDPNYVAPHEHTFNEGVCECGAACEHNWNMEARNGLCLTCGVVCQHNGASHVETIDATCTEEGYELNVCDICTASFGETKVLPVAEHVYVDGVCKCGAAQPGAETDVADAGESTDIFTVAYGTLEIGPANTLAEAIECNDTLAPLLQWTDPTGTPVVTLNTDYVVEENFVMNGEYPFVMDLNGKTLTVAEGATLSVNSNVKITGTGSVVGDVKLAESAQLNVAGSVNTNSLTVADSNGKAMVKGEDGNYVADSSEPETPAVTYVAEIEGGEKFETLGAAVYALQNGQTLKILQSFTPGANEFIELNGKTNVTITAAEDVVIDGSISFGYHVSHIDNNVDRSESTLTVKDLTVKGTLTVCSNDANLVVSGNETAQLTVMTYREAMNITVSKNTLDGSIGTAANSYGMYIVPDATGYNLTISDNYFENVNSHAIAIQGHGTSDGSVLTAANSIAVSGNTFESWGTGGKSNRAAFKIWNDTKYAPEGNQNPAAATVAMKDLAQAIGKDNSFNSTASNVVQIDAYGAAGNADAFVPSEPVPTYVAEVNGVKYTDLQEAIIKAAPSGTVELLSDVTVDKWIMISETLTIGNGTVITLAMDGLTIDGNGHTLTINDVESAGNGGHIFYDGDYNVCDLTVEMGSNVNGFGITSGTISDVTFIGGRAASGGAAIHVSDGLRTGVHAGKVTIDGCTFKNNGQAIYYETAQNGLVVNNNTFEVPTGANVILMRGTEKFTNNTVISGRTVNVISGSPVVTGNNFGDVRLKVYNVATATIENNTINTLKFEDETVAKSTFSNNTLSENAQAELDKVSAPAVTYVAEVNGTKYESLQAAVEAVKDGGTIVLISDVVINEQTRAHNSGTYYDGVYYVGDQSFTIDLAGFKITHDGSVNDYLLNFKNVGTKANTITIKNGTVDAGTNAFCALCTSSVQQNQLTINLENVSLINNISNGSVAKIRGGAILNVKAGTKITGKNSYLGIESWASTINIDDGAEIYMNGTSSDNGCLVGVGGNGTVNVYGGYGKGAKGGFIAMTSGGTINVSGGEWIANTNGTIGNNSNLYVLTAQNNKDEPGYAGASIINVTGGTFRGGMDAWVLHHDKGEVAELNISGGNFNANPENYVVDGYAALRDLNGNYVVGEKPTATVNDMGMTTVAAGGYMVYGGGDNTADMPLSFVMQFLADQTADDMANSPFADWYGDFVITFTGIENGSFTADGCYLAGHYGSFGWVKVPVDGLIIEEGARYPVMLGVGLGQKYDYICSSVQDFKCALYLTPEILAANPNLKVKLELAVVDNSKGSDAAAGALVNNEKVYSVTEYTYDAEDFVVKNYVAQIGEQKFESLADAVAYAKEQNMTDVVITLIGETNANTNDSFGLAYATQFDSVTINQADPDKTYYLYNLYTGSRTNGGKFIFDGVNIVVTKQYMFEGNVVLSNNSVVKSVADANCFMYYSNTTVEPGSKLFGVIDDYRGGDVIVDGGRTDGQFNAEADMQNAMMIINWSGDSLTIKNGAYVKVNAANEIGRLTVNPGASLNISDSKLDAVEYIAVNGTVNTDADSVITTRKITGAGKIVIDATGKVAGDEVKITADLSEFTGTLEVANNDKLEAKIVDGKIVLSVKPVAMIGETGYATLAAAIAAANTGDEIDLLADISTADTITINKSITLDGNGNTLTYTGTDRAIDVPNTANGANVTVKNLIINAEQANRGINYNTTGKFTVENVTVTIGANVDGYAINLPGSATGADVTIKNSKLTSRTPLNIWGKNAEINVEDTEIISVDNSETYFYSAIQLNKDTYGNAAEGTVVNVTGGKITALDEKGELSFAVTNWTETGVVNISETTEVTGNIKNIVAWIGGVGFVSLQDALESEYNGTIEILKDFTVSESITVPAGKKATIDLNGKIITGTDNATGSFGLINNRGELTINDSVGTGKITLTATNNRGWNAYSSVISNNPGGKLTVNGGIIEHLGGTDMAYGIDNLTNGKGTHAETVINGGTIKSTYRAIRQFLNGIEAQNILTVNGGTIEGANKSIWMQDPSKNANSGTLNVAADASLKGDVYLTVTAGSTTWPVEVAIAAAALKDDAKVLSSNVPSGYDVANVGDTWGIQTGVAKIGDQYYATFDAAYAAAQANDTITLLADVTASEIITIDKAITLDGNGKTLTSTKSGTSGRAINVSGADGVTIKNLTIKASGERAINIIQNATNVVIENVNATAANYTVNVAGSAPNAVVTIKDSTLTGLNVVNVASAGADVTITNSTINCNDNNTTAGESYAALCLNKAAVGGKITATKTTVNVTEGSDSTKGRNGAENGTVTINGSTEGVVTTVAVITYEGSDYYYGFTSIDEAIEFAKAGDIITLIRDVELSDILTIDKAITLDGNGKKLTSTAARAINVSGADGVTIKNLTIDASGERAINVINEATNVTIDNVTATAANYTVNVAASAPNAVVAIKGSTLNGLCTVNVASKGANVTVKDSTINCNDNNTTAGESYAALCLNKAAVDGKIIATNTTVNVTAGSDSTKGRNGAENGTVTINGSTEGVVTTVAVITYEGSDNYYGFESIADAIKFAKAGETVTLIRDVTASETVTINKSVTLDGNGKKLTYTGTNRAIDIPANTNEKVNVTFKDLTVDCAASYCERGINYNDDGALTLDNVTVKGTNVTYALNLPGSSDNTNVVINDSALTGNIALNVWGENATITATNTVFTSVDHTAVENYSAIALNNDGTTNANGTTITINGGKIIARDQNGDPSYAIRNSTATGNVTVSESTEVVGNIAAPVAIVTYGASQFYSCTTLQAAIDKAIATNGKVELIAAITLDAPATVSGNVTIDLKDHTLTGNIVLTDAAVVLTAPEGLKVTTNVADHKVVYENGMYKVVEKVYVAQIGEQKFETFEDAIKAAAKDATIEEIVILCDFVQETVENTEDYYHIVGDLKITAAEPVTVKCGIALCVKGGKLTVDKNVTIEGLDVVANGYATTGDNMTIEGTIKALSLKQWTSKGTITVTETGSVWLGYGDGQFDMAYGNGTVTINGNGDKTTAQFKAGYSGTRGNGNTLNLNNTYFEAGAWFEVKGTNITINVNNSLLAVSGGDASGALTIDAGNVINVGDGSAVKAGTITGAGKIVIDAAKLTAGPAPVSGNASAFTGEIKVINSDMTAEINENGQIVLVAPAYVASVTDAEGNVTEYTSLAAAVEAADNATVTLLDNIALDATVKILAGKTVTLDLNGKKIDVALTEGSTTNHIYAFENHGALTITGNGVINARGIFNYGAMTLTSGTINAIDANGGYAVRNYEGASFTMNGGTVATTNEDGDVPGNGYDATTIRVDEGATALIEAGVVNNISNYTFAVENHGTTTINGGEFTSGHTVVANYGNLTVNDGKFVCDGFDGQTQHVIWAADGTTTINDGTFDGKDTYNGFNVNVSEGAVVEIKGGSFQSVHSGSLYGEGTIAVSGGTFFDKVPENRCAEGYIPTANGDGTYGVKEGYYFAQIGETKYTSLAEAMAAAKTGDKVTLLRDCEATGYMVVPYGVTLELNGCVLNADYVIAIGQIQDSADEVGGIKAAKSNVILSNNTQMPLYDVGAGCYRFFEFTLARLLKTEIDSVAFGYRIKFTNSKAYELLRDHGADTGIIVKHHLDWTENSEGNEIVYTYNDAQIKKYGEMMLAGDEPVFMFTVTSISAVAGQTLYSEFNVQSLNTVSTRSREFIVNG